MGTSSKSDISAPAFLDFFLLKCTLDYQHFFKKDQSQRLSITVIINYETGSYLNVQNAIFHATLRQITC